MDDSGLSPRPLASFSISPSVPSRGEALLPRLSLAIWNDRHHVQLGIPGTEFRLDSGHIHPLDFDVQDEELADFQFLCRLKSAAGNWDEFPQLELVNQGRVLLVDNGRRLYPQETSLLPLPVQLQIGKTVLELQCRDHSFVDLQRVSSLPAADGRIGVGTFPLQSLGLSPSPVTLAHWFDALTELQRLSTVSREFLDGCTRAVIDPGGLDMAMILRFDQDRWEVLASHVPDSSLGISFPWELVEQARLTGQTQYSDPCRFESESDPGDARYGVAAPYFDRDQTVCGVVYAMRVPHRHNARRGIRLLEAQFVNLIADAVTSGTLRMTQEADNVRQQLLLEHAFSPRVARQLRSDPTILEAQNREVTLLFADLRDSTRLAQRLSPHRLYELLADLMDHWTQAVSELDGVILDYYGDGLAAFWNAPLDQSEHVQLACLAALAALERLPELSQRWEHEVGQPLEFAMGVHTGLALVGNSGTARRIKYGPRGETVHLANRVEAAAKSIGLPLVISQSAFAQLPSSFLTRRLGRVRIPGIAEPESIFQPLAMGTVPAWHKQVQTYETALEDYEQGHLASALGRLSEMLVDYPQDRAVRWLLEWVQRAIKGTVARRAGDSTAVFVPLQLD